MNNKKNCNCDACKSQRGEKFVPHVKHAEWRKDFEQARNRKHRKSIVNEVVKTQ